jgi:hypothetical protein
MALGSTRARAVPVTPWSPAGQVVEAVDVPRRERISEHAPCRAHPARSRGTKSTTALSKTPTEELP